MRILRFDSVGGASGDMIFGALAGLGGDLEGAKRDLARLLPGHFTVDFNPVTEEGIAGVRLTVLAPEADHHDHGPHDHDHGPRHSHGIAPHDHEHHHHRHGPGHHDHHDYAAIRELIAGSELPEPVRRDSLGVFSLLAEAEGRVHGVPPEAVRFHEVGAVDSIVDIVGCCYLYHSLGIDAVSCGVIPTGSGTVRCQHGVLPVPAPATAELLRAGAFRVSPGPESGELLTPTGAALLTYWRPVELPPVRVTATASAFGRRKLEHSPNLLRAALCESDGASGASGAPGEVFELACNLDDVSGEVLGDLLSRLLAAGALDAWCEPLTMKNSRPGVKLAVLAAAADRNRVAELMLAGSGSFGVRMHLAERLVLDRQLVETDTAYGRLPVKLGFLNGRLVSAKPEFAPCARAAAAAGVPVRTVLAAALAGCPGAGKKL